MQLRMAFRLFQQGQLDQAKAMCGELLEAGLQVPAALMLLSAILHRQGDQPAAVQHVLRAASLQAGDTTAQLQLIRALRNMGAFAEASKLLAPLDKNSPEVILSQNQLDWQSGSYDRALAGFTAAACRWPGNLDLLLAYCRALVRLGQLDLGEKTLLSALARWPDQPEIAHLLAILQLDRSKPDLALGHLRCLAGKAGPDTMAQRLLVALQALHGEVQSPASNHADAIERSFSWARNQSANIRWFGSNTGLLQWAMQEIAADSPAPGPVVECGVYHGFSLAQIAASTERRVHGFDSFEGLPEEWKPGEPAGSYSTQGQTPPTAAHVKLHRGWFEDTLPGFAAQLHEPIALLHVDCDLYSSTRTVLSILGPKLGKGSLLVFDDFLAYEGFEQHEYRAAHEYFAVSEQRFGLVGAVLLGRAVAYRRLD